MNNFKVLFGRFDRAIPAEEIASLLKTSPEQLKAFEDAYAGAQLRGESGKDILHINSRETSASLRETLGAEESASCAQELTRRIVGELLADSGLKSCLQNL